MVKQAGKPVVYKLRLVAPYPFRLPSIKRIFHQHRVV